MPSPSSSLFGPREIPPRRDGSIHSESAPASTVQVVETDPARGDITVFGYTLRRLIVVGLAAKLVAVLLWCFTAHRAAAIVTFFAPDPFLFYALIVPSAQGVCRTFTHFETDRKSLWLTIDDGPDEHDTPKLLALLDRHDARATFFVIGERAARLPHLIREIVRRGHTVAHHTHTHPSVTFWCAGPSRLARELDATSRTLESAGVHAQWFRPPVGIRNFMLEPALGKRGLKSVGWTLRSGDCHMQTPEELTAAVVPKVRPGAIILLHEGKSVSSAVRVRGIELLLEALTAMKFRCEIPAPHQLRR